MSSQRQYVRIWWWWLSFDGDMRAIQRTYGVYICMIYIYIHTFTGYDLWCVFFLFDDDTRVWDDMIWYDIISYHIFDYYDTCVHHVWWTCDNHEFPRVSLKRVWICFDSLVVLNFWQMTWYCLWAIIIFMFHPIVACMICMDLRRLQQLQSPQRKKLRVKFRLCSRSAVPKGWDVPSKRNGTWEDKARWTNNNSPGFTESSFSLV